MNILCENRIGTWNSVEIDPNFKSENDFAAFWLPHGKRPSDMGYAYVILPCKSAEETQSYAADPHIEILENTTNAHAVRNSKLWICGINFWSTAPYTCCGITCSGQGAVMVKTTIDGWEIAVSDPTKTDQVMELSFPFCATSVDMQDDRIQVARIEPLKLQVDTKNTHGKTLHCKMVSKVKGD